MSEDEQREPPELADMPKKPTLKEKRYLIKFLDCAMIGETIDVGAGFTMQKVDEETIRFIQAHDHPVVEHIVSLFIKAGEQIGISVEITPYLILTPPLPEDEKEDEGHTDDNDDFHDIMFG